MLLAVIECLKGQLERNQEEGKKQNRTGPFITWSSHVNTAAMNISITNGNVEKVTFKWKHIWCWGVYLWSFSHVLLVITLLFWKNKSFHAIITRHPSIQSIQTGQLKNMIICKKEENGMA